MTKHFCDCCGKELKPPKVNLKVVVANIETVDLSTGKVTSYSTCENCTPTILETVEKIRNDNGITELTPGVDIKFPAGRLGEKRP